MKEKIQCSKRIRASKGGFSGHLCTKPAVINTEGKWYCTIHSPEYMAKQAFKRMERIEKERKVYKEFEKKIADEKLRRENKHLTSILRKILEESILSDQHKTMVRDTLKLYNVEDSD
jgi:hypothetical protein